MTIVNPVDSPTALLRKSEPAIMFRYEVYDPTYDNPDYQNHPGQKIVPAPGSIVKDADGTPLWVTAIDPDTLFPSYTPLSVDPENAGVLSLLNYGNTVLRLYGDYRRTPYPVTPDSKCVFIGKSPRFYTLSRFPNTPQETIVSQYFDATGTLISQMVPLKAMDTTNTSWYLPRCNITQVIPDNEEILVKIYDENQSLVSTVTMFAKESAVINEDVVYSPTITAMTVTGNQMLADGTFYLFETQDFNSLGLTANLVYSDGTSAQVPVDGIKCIMYGHDDFISSFAGLRQYVYIKYFRSQNEAIAPIVADATGQMITVKIPVTVVPNTLGITTKIMAMPIYNGNQARYMVRYYMYYGDGRGFTDVTANVSLTGTLNGTSAFFGIAQSIRLTVDMHQVDPTNYPVTTTYQQSMVITFYPPTQLVKWTIRDALTSQYIYGQDISSSRRPALRWDANRGQYFIGSNVFGNKAAFLNSFYYMASPPYDPNVSQIPQTPTHFVVRDVTTGNMLVPAPIPVDSYSSPFSIINDTSGQYNNAVVIVEFLNIINITTRRVLFGVPVNVTAGAYVS